MGIGGLGTRSNCIQEGIGGFFFKGYKSDEARFFEGKNVYPNYLAFPLQNRVF